MPGMQRWMRAYLRLQEDHAFSFSLFFCYLLISHGAQGSQGKAGTEFRRQLHRVIPLLFFFAVFYVPNAFFSLCPWGDSDSTLHHQAAGAHTRDVFFIPGLAWNWRQGTN